MAAPLFAALIGLGLAGLGGATPAQARPGPYPQWCPGDNWDPGWGDNSDWNHCHDWQGGPQQPDGWGPGGPGGWGPGGPGGPPPR